MVVHRDLDYHYSFFYPDGWCRAELASSRGQGVIYSPSPDDVATSFSVEATDLGTRVSARDLPTLREGLVAGLRQLVDSQVEELESYSVGGLVGLEARHTYREGQALRKRWVRLLYQGSVQVRLIAQGASVQEFERWLPMFYQSMRTFKFGDWWAEVTGQEWLPSLTEPSGPESSA